MRGDSPDQTCKHTKVLTQPVGFPVHHRRCVVQAASIALRPSQVHLPKYLGQLHRSFVVEQDDIRFGGSEARVSGY